MWNRAGDPAWAPGNYVVHCSGHGSVLGEVRFEVAMNPPDASEIDLRVTQIHLFPASGPLPARDQRDYMTRFPARKTSRIGVELEFTHSATSGNAGLAMGWDSPGRWSQGHYTVVCNLRGRPVAVERFVVD